MTDSVLFYAVILPITLVAGFVRGMSGFGGPTILIPSLQLFLPPKISVGAALLVDLLANVRLIPDARQNASARVLLPLTIGALVGLPVGLAFLTMADPAIAKRAISAVTLAACLVMLTGWRLPRPLNGRGLLVAGGLGGLSLGASGISLIVSMALQAGPGSSVRGRANFVMWAFIFTLIAIAGLLLAEWPSIRHAVVQGLVLLPAYLTGIILGIASYKRINEPLLRALSLCLAAATATMGLF
jgi:uncharacterized membrane protein YfcA